MLDIRKIINIDYIHSPFPKYYKVTLLGKADEDKLLILLGYC